MSSNIPKPNATVTDAVNYVQQDPSVLVRLYSGIKELVTIIFLIFKPGIKSPTPYGK